MARKVLLDVDPGIDDALAMCLAFFEPELDVVAVTAVGGNVSPNQATRNVQVILEQLDPEDRSGRAEALGHLGELNQLQGDLAGAQAGIPHARCARVHRRRRGRTARRGPAWATSAAAGDAFGSDAAPPDTR